LGAGANSAAPPAGSGDGGSKGPPIALIAGVVGGVLGLLLIACAVFAVFMYKR